MSSGESEFAALTKGASVALGLRSIRDFGAVVSLTLHTDSSTAKSISGRRGVGKIRHLHTPLLWLQQKVTARELAVAKIEGQRNRSDLGTKELAGPRMLELLSRCGFVLADGRHPLALKAQVGT